MGRFTPKTRRGYLLSECASALQKAIRRSDVKLAGHFALEMAESGYAKYVWKRLLTVSAEDCWGIITMEIKALHGSWVFINENHKGGEPFRGRIFISKAVIMMCEALKSRDADHLQNFVYDRKLGIEDHELLQAIQEAKDDPEPIPIPEYAYDVHTAKGKAMGKTKEDFFREEQNALEPKKDGHLDHLVPGKKQQNLF